MGTIRGWSIYGLRTAEGRQMGKLAQVQRNLAEAGKLGPVARLMPTTAATTLRKSQEPPLVIDGLFAETKEQLLGFYLVEAVGLEEALDIARELGAVNPGNCNHAAVAGS